MNYDNKKIMEISLKKATSTNDIAKKIDISAPVMIITADLQTKGRGRFSERSWFSPKDSGLYISVVFSDTSSLDADCLCYITKMISLAVYDTLNTYDLPLFIKPPNDIFTDKGKISGVLAESKTKGDVIERIVASAGINILRPDNLPDDIIDSCCFLSDLKDTGIEEIKTIKEIFIKNLLHYFKLVQNKKYSLIDEKFTSYLI